MRNKLIALTVLVCILVLSFPLARAISPSPEYSLGVTDKAVSVSLSLDLSQNLTAFEKSFALPQLHSIIEGVNSNASEAVQAGLQTRSPQARVSGFKLEVDSSPWSNVTGLQWFNVSLTMTVTGVLAIRNGAAQVDLSWKSFNVSSSIPLGGVEVNNIGEKLLAKVASDLARQTSANPAITFRFLVGNVEVGAPSFPSLVEQLRTLSFSSFATPLSGWKGTYDPLAQTTTWALSPGGVFLGMTFEQLTQESERVTETIVYRLTSTLTGKIVGPGRFTVNGDTLTFPVNNIPEAMMGVVILSLSITLVGATVYERKVLNKPIRRKLKR